MPEYDLSKAHKIIAAREAEIERLRMALSDVIEFYDNLNRAYADGEAAVIERMIAALKQ